MISATLQPLDTFWGDTLTFTFQVVNPTTGAPIDLTNGDLEFSAWLNLTDQTPLILHSVALGGVALLTPASGIVQVTLVPADTSVIPVIADPTELLYFCRAKPSDGSGPLTCMYGTLTISPTGNQ